MRRDRLSLFGLGAAMVAVALVTGGCDFITNASQSTAGTGQNTHHPSLSNDGRIVAFAAKAVRGSDLVAPGDGLELFARDLRTGTVTAISTPLSGAPQGQSQDASISADGRVVAFASGNDNLVPGDTNGSYDIFVRRLDGSATQRVNLGPQGVQGNLSSLEPSISGDGNLVVFSSDASTLAPGDTNNRTDVYLANVSAHTVTRITGATGGSHPTISADGRFVAFNSDDPNLVPNDTNGHWDIFVKELSTGNFRLASVAANGGATNQSSIFTAISRDGRYVAFVSEASNLVPADTDQNVDLFRRDLTNNTTEWISVAADGGPGREPNGNPGGAFMPAISGNGRQVTFISRSSNLTATPSPNQGRDQAFVRDVESHRTTYGSANNAGGPASGDGVSTNEPMAISGDGRYVAFGSNATNLIGGEPVDATMDIYVRYSTQPEVRTVSPSTVARGATTTITLSGVGFLSGATIAVSGTGVQVTNTTINSANTAHITVTVAANAPVGPRDITVTNVGSGPGPAANSVSTCGQCLRIT